MRLYLLAVLATGCGVSATYQGRTTTPIADRAVVIDAGQPAPGEHVGSIDTSGGATRSLADLTDRAAALAAVRGGTHIKLSNSGDAISTYTTPASETQNCTHDDTTNTDNCTTTYTPESTSTVVTPYASYDVFRAPAEQWSQLPDGLRPDAYDPAHHSPSVADGPSTTIGAFLQPAPGDASGTSGFVFPTTYTRNPTNVGGAWFATSMLWGSTELALDLKLGGGSYDGMAMRTDQSTQPVHYTGTYFGSAVAVRLGKRVAWDNFALAAGVGVGGALWGGMTSVDPGAPIDSSFVEPPGGLMPDFYLPLWSSVTIKPSCNWGVQGLAEYDERPLDTGDSSPAFGIGVIWQPATACN